MFMSFHPRVYFLCKCCLDQYIFWFIACFIATVMPWRYLILKVKKLEELGIGRPSTYASTLKVLQVSVSELLIAMQKFERLFCALCSLFGSLAYMVCAVAWNVKFLPKRSFTTQYIFNSNKRRNLLVEKSEFLPTIFNKGGGQSFSCAK